METTVITAAKKIIMGLYSGRPKWPASVQLSPADTCNFHCRICWVHGPDSVASRGNLDAAMFENIRPTLMGFDMYRNLIDGLTKMGRPYISFCGRGEPTLNPNFEEMITLASGKGFRCGLITNGSRLNAEFLKALDGANIYVSLNTGDAGSHEEFCGVGGQFDKITGTIAQYNAEGGGINFGLSFVIGSHNISGIRKMAEVSSRILRPGSRIFFYPEWTHEGNREHNVSENQLREFLAGMPSIKAHLKSRGILHNLDALPAALYAVSLSAEHEHPTREYYLKHPCTTVDEFFVVSADGRMFPCCNSAYELGNISEHSVIDIWMSERAADFRRRAHNLPSHKTELPLSNCFYCSHVQEATFFGRRYGAQVLKRVLKYVGASNE